jgi:hypothetical protein
MVRSRQRRRVAARWVAAATTKNTYANMASVTHRYQQRQRRT